MKGEKIEFSHFVLKPVTKTELPQGETIAPHKFLVLKNKRRNLLISQPDEVWGPQKFS